MAVGGARGIAVDADAVVVAGCGGSNPDTSQDQLPREPAIGAAATGNPRSRQEKKPGFCKEERRREEVAAVVVNGGSRPPAPLFYLSLREGEGGGQGPEIFPLSHFGLLLLLVRWTPPRLMGLWWNRGKLFGIGFCSFLGVV